MLIRYILDADIDKTAFDRRVVQVISPSIRKTAMTLADQYREEGLQKGRQEGRQEGQLLARQAAVIDTLEIRFHHLPGGLREEIAHISNGAQLQALLRAAIQSASLEDFTRAL